MLASDLEQPKLLMKPRNFKETQKIAKQRSN